MQYEFQGRLWVPARWIGGGTLPAFGSGCVVSMGETAAGDVFLNVGKLTDATLGKRSLVIAGPAGLGVGSSTVPDGVVTYADGYPMQALYTGDAPQAGDVCGPYPDGTALKRGYPGFRAQTTGANGGVFVVRDGTESGSNAVFIAVLSAKWNYAAPIPYCYNCKIHAIAPNGTLGDQVAVASIFYPSAPQNAASYAKVPIGIAGTWATVRKDSVSGLYVVIEAPTGLTYRAVANATIAKGETKAVTIVDGPVVMAKDCVLATGDSIVMATKIVISWCEQEGVFLIVAAECEA